MGSLRVPGGLSLAAGDKVDGDSLGRMEGCILGTEGGSEPGWPGALAAAADVFPLTWQFLS